MTNAGVIRRLARYPVKSMRGEELAATELTLQGVPEDRRYAFVQAESRSGFPWLTGRQMAELICYGTSVDEVAVTVTGPDGEEWPVQSEELRRDLERRSGRSLFLLRDDRGSYDVAQVSLISVQTVARIAAESGTAEDAWRFRPNVLVDLGGGEAFDELEWVGRIVRVGSARIAITEVDQRCVMITLDPGSGAASPAVLRCVAQLHGGSAGVYGSVVTAGEVRVGDLVAVET